VIIRGNRGSSASRALSLASEISLGLRPASDLVTARCEKGSPAPLSVCRGSLGLGLRSDPVTACGKKGSVGSRALSFASEISLGLRPGSVAVTVRGKAGSSGPGTLSSESSLGLSPKRDGITIRRKTGLLKSRSPSP